MQGKTTALRGKEGRPWRRGGTEKGTVRVSRSAVAPVMLYELGSTWAIAASLSCVRLKITILVTLSINPCKTIQQLLL